MNEGEQLKEIRQELGLSQSKFAQKFHVPLSTYIHWEVGMRKPPKYIIYMIQYILQLEERERDK